MSNTPASIPSPNQAPQPQPDQYVSPIDQYNLSPEAYFAEQLVRRDRINANLRALFPSSYPEATPQTLPQNNWPAPNTQPAPNVVPTPNVLPAPNNLPPAPNVLHAPAPPAPRLYTAEEVSQLLAQNEENARRAVAQSLQGGEQQLDTSDSAVFDQVALASKTLFVEGTNLPTTSKDRGRIAPDYDHAVNGCYPIPTMREVRGVQEELAPVNMLERVVRRAGVSAYLTLEEFVNENQKRSNFNKKAMELMNELQGTGNDSQIRGLFAKEVRPGVWVNIHSGEEFSAADVADARRKWFQDPSHFAAAFWYEIHKSASEDEFNFTLERTFEMLNEAASRRGQTFAGVRFSNRDIAGILLGVGYAHKGIHQTLKHLNAGVNSEGLWEYRGVKGIKLLTELSTKLRPHEVANLSPIDVGNIAFITQNALMASVEYKNNPKSPEFIKSQYILQRAAKLISDMRYASTVDPEGSDAEALKFRQELQSRGLLSRPAIRIGRDDGLLYLDGQPLRSGASSLSSAGWEQVAGFTDVACELFPNIKYIDRSELTTLDRTAERAVEKAKQAWIKEHGSLTGFNEEDVIKYQALKAAEIIKTKNMAPGYRRTKKLRRQHRRNLNDKRSEMIDKNNRDLKETREQRRARERAEWLDPRNR
jgi:hypothetical protein